MSVKFVNAYFMPLQSAKNICEVIEFYRKRHHDFTVDFSNDFVPVCVGPAGIYIDISADLANLSRICSQIDVTHKLVPSGFAVTPDTRNEMRRALDDCYKIIIMSNTAARTMLTKNITYTKMCDLLNEFDYMSAITLLTKDV